MSKTTVIVLALIGIGIVGLMAAYLLHYTVDARRSGAELERRYAEIRAKGEPVSADDFHYKKVDPEKNAETYIRRAKVEIEKIHTKLHSLEERFHEEHGYDKDFDYKNYDSAFATHSKIIQLLEKAAKCPEYSSDFSKAVANAKDLHIMKVKHLEDNHFIAKILCRYRVQHLLAKGKRDEAVQSCVTLLRLIRKFENDPTLLNYTEIACNCRAGASIGLHEALQSGQVSYAVRQELADELAKHNIRKTFLQALKSERPFELAAFDYLRREGNWFSQAAINRQTLDYLNVTESRIARVTASLSNKAKNSYSNYFPIFTLGFMV